MEKVIIWYGILQNAGDFSLKWFLSKNEANRYIEKEEIQLEDSICSVETFVDSDIFNKAKQSRFEEEIYDIISDYLDINIFNLYFRKNKVSIYIEYPINSDSYKSSILNLEEDKESILQELKEYNKDLEVSFPRISSNLQ